MCIPDFRLSLLRIVLKLYASLAEQLPATARNHSVDLEVQEGETPNEVLARHVVDRERVHLLLRNGVYLSPSQRDQVVLQDGDVLAAWPPIAGG